MKKTEKNCPGIVGPYIEKSSFWHVFWDNLCQYRYKEPCDTILCVYRGTLCLFQQLERHNNPAPNIE